MAVLLPQGSEVEPSVRRFLDERFRNGEDLRGIANIEKELQGRCSDLEAAVVDLDDRLRQQLAAYAARAAAVDDLLRKVRGGLINLRSITAGSSPDGGSSGEIEAGSSAREKITADKLLPLAKEVARVENVHTYAETALKLDRLIGEIEDAVASTMTGKIRRHPSSENSEGLLLTAIDHLKKTEEIIASVSKLQPRWRCLIAAVDDRVDRALAVLRPQAIAEHRSLLVSLGWPPPLSSSDSDNPIGSKSMTSRNPLLTMNVDQKQRYDKSFLSLCCLQEFQSRRRLRHLGDAAACQQLWGIEELATPISLSSQKHFPKWIHKPEFIFALAYKITRDLANTMDEVLQPLVDRARLAGYSCREEWVAAMVSFLSTYLAKEVFPVYVSDLEREAETSDGGAKVSWLNLVDQMMMFDKRARDLVTSSGLIVSTEEEGELQRISSMSVFCDRPDWLDLWAEMELADVLDQLKPQLEDPRIWKHSNSPEDFKSPAAAVAVLRKLSTVIERCRPLPSVHLRARFVCLAAAPLLRVFTSAAAGRCQEAEALTALVDDEALAKVCSAINGARHCEVAVAEWLEDLFFLEMAVSSGDGGGGVLEAEVEALRRLRVEWLDKVKAAIIRGFETACRDHLKNKKQWQEGEVEEGELTFSNLFIGVLDYLQGKLRRMEAELNVEDFAVVWRGVAAAVDQLLVGRVLLSGAKFSAGGAARFGGDLAALCGVFSPWCLRPEGFFPWAVEGLSLLRGDEEEGACRRLRHLTAAEVERIIKSKC